MKAIMYHYVSSKDENFPGLYRLDFEDFKRQLDFFEKEYGFIEKKDFIESVNNGKTCKGVILTFDDGLRCHYDYVYKELIRRNLWGIFYIPTLPFTRSKILDVHRIHILISKVESKKIYNYLDDEKIYNLFDNNKLHEFEKYTYHKQKDNEYTLIIKRILNYFISYEHREYVIDKLFKKFIDKKINTDIFYLSIDNLIEMKNNGMIIGNHSVSHKVLSKLSYEEQQIEINSSYNFLTKKLGSLNFKTFCFPYGGFLSFNEDTEKILLLEKFHCAFNVESRDITEIDLKMKVLKLPRYDCNEFKFGETSKN